MFGLCLISGLLAYCSSAMQPGFLICKKSGSIQIAMKSFEQVIHTEESENHEGKSDDAEKVKTLVFQKDG